MGESEESTQLPPPYVTVELETLRQKVQELQQQLAVATTLEDFQQVQGAAVLELRLLSRYIDMFQVLQMLVERAQQHIDGLPVSPDS
jgi:hypothetical protein